LIGSQRAVVISLGLLLAALLFVGAVGGTVLRHIVQGIPSVIALVFVARRPALGAWSAIPIFVFWSFIVVLIWLYLLGVNRIASGHYTSAEFAATVVMAGACAFGASRSLSLGEAAAVSSRVVVVLAFGLLQVAAMWLSLMKGVATR
jgi:hypothetical protein